MRHVTLCALAFSLLAVRPVAAQQPISLVANARMRISAPARKLRSAVARVVEQRGDSVAVYLLQQKESLTLGLSELSSLDVSREQHGHALKGMGMGLVIGAALGATLGYASGDNPSCGLGDLTCTAQQKAAAGGVVFGILGALLGPLATPKTDDWSPVPLKNVVIAPTFDSRGTGHRLGLRLSLSF